MSVHHQALGHPHTCQVQIHKGNVRWENLIPFRNIQRIQLSDHLWVILDWE